MKINFSHSLLDIHGQPLRKNGADSDEAQLLDFVLNALNAPTDKPDSVETKVRIFKLLLLVKDGGHVEIQPEDVALIKERIGFHYPPLIVGRAFEVLNG